MPVKVLLLFCFDFKHLNACSCIVNAATTNADKMQIGRRKEKQVFANNKKGEPKSREKKSEATVIVNIVIVIGSNNHILISCVYGFGSTLTLCLRDYKHNGAVRKNVFK